MTNVSQAISRGLMIAIFMALGLYVVIDVMLAEGRSLAQLYLYIAIAAFIFGAVSARPAFFLCLITTGYIDLFKRLMAAFGRPQPQDLYYILGVPPLLIAGAVANVLIQFLIGRKKLQVIHLWTFGTSCALLGFALLQAASNSGYRAMGDAVNQGAYAFLLFLVPEIIPSPQDRARIFRWMVPIFTGVAIYMLRHHFFGLADFEYDYLASGLSIESRILWENDGALRGFSTMAGAAVVAVFCSIMPMVVLVVPKKNGNKPTAVEMFMRVMLAVLFLYAAWTTVSRGGWVCGIAAYMVYFILKTKRRATIGYAMGGLAFFALIFSAPVMRKNNTLGAIEDFLRNFVGSGDNAYAKRAIVMGTANDRLKGWANLTTNPDVWTPFGFKHAGIRLDEGGAGIMEYGHDFIIEFLIKAGYVPMFILIAVGGFLFVKINQMYFQIPPDSEERKVNRIALAVGGGIFVGGFGNGAQLWVYPQNFYFFLSLAVVFTLYVNEWKRKRMPVFAPIEEPEPVALPAPSVAGRKAHIR